LDWGKAETENKIIGRDIFNIVLIITLIRFVLLNCSIVLLFLTI
jgi:hypothetical protein